MSVGLSDKLTLPEGAIIACPNPKCRSHIGRLTRDLKPGDRLTSDMLDESGQGVRLDKKMQCKICNFHWFVSTHDMARIHTARGWFPPEKNMVDAFNAVN